tara:strand:- start:27191 stop:27976 length:786 start_codon:yes stop_codon:yes gene_type:complete
MDARTSKQFEFIELVLAYEGLLTNQRMRETFGISSVQASRIIATYRNAYPRNTSPIKGEGRGRYMPTSRFSPAIATLSIDQYFRAVANTSINVEMEEVRQDFTHVDPGHFRVLHASVTMNGAVQIIYRSMNNPGGTERVVHPRAFVFAGRRWHLRAFDETTEEHRDFNLARICGAELVEKATTTPPDFEWDEYVNLQLRPHPRLNSAQEQLIRDELFNGAAGRQVTTRRALVRYVLRDLEVAENPDTQQPPEYQLYLYRID